MAMALTVVPAVMVAAVLTRSRLGALAVMLVMVATVVPVALRVPRVLVVPVV